MMRKQLKQRFCVDVALFFILFLVWLFYSFFVIQKLQFLNISLGHVDAYYGLSKFFVQILGYTTFVYPLVDFLAYRKGLSDGAIVG